MALFGCLDRFLAGDHQHGHAAELSVRSGGHEVGRARTERGQAHAGLAGETSVGRGHESRALLVARQDQLDRRRAQRFEQIEIFFAGNPEHVFHVFGFECFHEQVGRFHRIVSPFNEFRIVDARLRTRQCNFRPALRTVGRDPPSPPSPARPKAARASRLATSARHRCAPRPRPEARAGSATPSRHPARASDRE